MTGATAEIIDGASRIGRYFSVISVTTSTTLVLFTIALFGSGALTHEPDASALVSSVRDTSLADVGLVALAVLVVGLLLHPMQYAFVQVLEGYWGVRSFAVNAMEAFTERHTRRRHDLDSRKAQAKLLIRHVDVVVEAIDADPRGPLSASSDRDGLLRQRARLAFTVEETDRLLGKYPDEDEAAMPTVLGNRLRRAERLAGRTWGIDVTQALPHLTLVAAPREEAYFRSTLGEVDIAVRFCVVWSIATVMSTGVLWRYGWWLLIPMATYSLAYFSYRGAAVAADEHGAAMITLVDLNRFALYERMGLRRPKSTAGERSQNRKLQELLGGSTQAVMRYAPAPETATMDVGPGSSSMT